MIPAGLTIIDTPNVNYIREYDLDELLDAKEAFGKVILILSNELIGTKIDTNLILYRAKSFLRTILQVQIESRGFPIDLHQIAELSDAVFLDQSQLQSSNIELLVPPGWDTKVNNLFHVWECPRCGKQILDSRHSQEECYHNIVSDVIDE